MPASRWASCKSHNQNIQAARCVANGARRDRTSAFAKYGIKIVPSEKPKSDIYVELLPRVKTTI